MDFSQLLGISAVIVLAVSRLILGDHRYSRYPNVKFTPPGSRLLDCPAAVRCSSLFCAAECAVSDPGCWSFSYSSRARTCLLTDQVFVPSSSNNSVVDLHWSTYKLKEEAAETDSCSSQPCQNGGTCSINSTASGFVCECSPETTGSQCEITVLQDCTSQLDSGMSTSGIFTVYPDDVTRVSVYYDQDTDGRGCLVFQRRHDGSEDFARSFSEYQQGFGNNMGEFWLGLDNLRLFMVDPTVMLELRVEVGESRDRSRHAIYSNFRLDQYNYALQYDSFHGGDAGDSQGHLKGLKFHVFPGQFCDAMYSGTWWGDQCMYSNLNGRYGATHTEGVKWYTYGSSVTSHDFCEMKIRPV